MARDFPGTANNYLRVNNPLGAIDLTGTALSIAAWVRPDSATIGYNQVAGKEPAVVNHGGYALGNGRVAIFDDPRAVDAASAPSITTGVWQHWLGWKSGTGANALRLYINGVQAAAVTSNKVIPDNSAGFTVGARDPGDLPFDGLIGEVAVWNVPLSADEITALSRGSSPYNIQRLSLCGYWPMWGVGPYVGTGELDVSGGAAHLTQVGSVGFPTTHPPVGPMILAA